MTGRGGGGQVRPGRALARAWRGAWAEVLANQRGFWAQVGMMAANDAMWIVFWFVFFREVGTVRGWRIDDVIVLMAVAATAVGVTIGALADSRRLGLLVQEGGIDAVLALPVRPLPYLLCRRVDPANVGDIAFGLILFLTLGHPTPQRLAVFVLCSLCASLVLIGFVVTLASLSFRTGTSQSTDLGLNALVLFSMYPVDVFGGTLKLVLYGVIPSALVSSVPARLVDRFDPVAGAALVGAAAVFAGLGWFSFEAGLRHYTSGATWTDA